MHIAVYGSHNSSVCIGNDNGIIEVIELERFINLKNAAFDYYNPVNNVDLVINHILEYFYKKYHISSFDTCLHQNFKDVENRIPATKYTPTLHHESHAYSSFYQSPHQKANILSYDGGGNDGFLNIYYLEKGKEIKIISKKNINLGFNYMCLGHFSNEIRRETSIYEGNLVYPGKLMGLCGYGEIQKEWIDDLKVFYSLNNTSRNYKKAVGTLFKQIGLDNELGITNEDFRDLAATSQKVFEDLVLEEISVLDKNTALHLTGGCALNIILNTRLEKEGYNTFISPNPNDSGLAFGMMAGFIKSSITQDATYSGSEIYDYYSLGEYINEYPFIKADCTLLANELNLGKIIGVVKGRSEHGPRALGNRSILCNPAIKNMKRILNEKVKNREPYRPFAPVVRLDDLSQYFNWSKESRWMSYAIEVKKEWTDKLSSITHIDGTARVQTITKEQNNFLYDLITSFKKISGHGVLLNTSFNIAGKPILNTYKDALELFLNSEMDGLLLDNYYLTKENLAQNKSGFIKTLAKAKHFFQTQEFDTSMDCYLAASKIRPKEIEPLIGIANIHMRKKDWKKAEKLWSDVLLIDSNNTLALNGIAEIKLHTGAFKLAGIEFNNIIKKFPNSTIGYFGLGRVHTHLKKFTEALEIFEKGLIKDKQALKLLEYKGNLLLRLNKNKEAEDTFSILHDFHPQRPIGLLGIARIRKREKDIPKAHTILKSLRLSYPNDIRIQKEFEEVDFILKNN